jgi:NodT family efflux transporter outer membrane factor (OMF) lipoprotein
MMFFLNRFSWQRCLATAGLLLLGGCAVGPDYQPPAAPKVSGYTAEPLPAETASADAADGEAQHFKQGGDIPAQWWTLFHSQPLNDLIEQSLKANPNLDAAKASLRVAQEGVSAQAGAYLPSVQASFTPTRNKNASQPAPTLASNVLLYNLYTAQLNAIWTLDVFGLNRRTMESLKAQEDAQRFQLESAYLTLTSSVVATAVQEASLREQIAATQEVIKINSEQLDVMRKQFDLGQIAQADVKAQEAALAQAQAGLPPLQKQLAQQRDLLAALAGQFPGENSTPVFDLADLQLPQDIPVSLPSKLVEQRPDVLSAEANLHAASALVGVAEANRLPNITLSAGGGSVATTLSQLFTPGNQFWSIGAGITQPIFEGGMLLHKQRGAEAAYDAAGAQYRSTVIAAFQNVADALTALQSDADALKANLTAEQSASESLDIVRRQVELGDISYLSALNAEQTYQQARINFIQAQANRLADTAVLFQALGGGWWNGPDAASPPTVSTTGDSH